jgi:hypothetical protein
MGLQELGSRAAAYVSGRESEHTRSLSFEVGFSERGASQSQLLAWDVNSGALIDRGCTCTVRDLLGSLQSRTGADSAVSSVSVLW